MKVPIVVLAVVFALIAVRRIGRVRLQIWQIMLGGAVAVLLTGQIAPLDALKAINVDVMLFLFGMFVVGQALEESGLLAWMGCRCFRKARSVDAIVLWMLFGAGIAAAFLMNDTLAIVGTPVALQLARKQGIRAKLLLLTLAFAVTIGSVTSPIGNPQNLLIALGPTVKNPFVDFARYLFVPTLVNMLAAYGLLRLFYWREFAPRVLEYPEESITDEGLARISKVSLALLALLIAAKIALVLAGASVQFRLTYIALVAALPILLFSRRRREIVRRIDWSTLVFFAAMFALMRSVWDCGYFQSLIRKTDLNIVSIAMIMVVSVVLSQLISNVPLVALYLPLLTHAGAGVREMTALAAGSTIAGNLFILGAASNVIIIQNAERKGGETLTFLEFARVGAPLTVLNALVYWAYLRLV